MTDTVMTILGIVLAVLIMFIFPVVAIATNHDKISQTTVEAVVSDFVNTIAEKGKITEFDYNALIQKISSTGNTFDVQIELQILDDNPERKTVTTSTDASIKGENLYYSVYTENITEKLRAELEKNREYNLKKDDYIIVTVKNTNLTIGTMFKNLFYNMIGRDTYTIGASAAALVTNTGQEEQDKIEVAKVNEEFKDKTVKMREQVEGGTIITKQETNITMVVILDSDRLCTPYHAGNTDRKMFASIQSIYNTLNTKCDDFYLGFIETANPNNIICQATKNNPPNTNQLTGDILSGSNWNQAFKRAINKIETESEGKETARMLVFMSWGSGVKTDEIAAVNTTLAQKINSIDKFFTMGCCHRGSIDTHVGSWYATMGNKSGGHLPAGIVEGGIESGVITHTEVKEGRDETKDVVSENGRLLLNKLDRSKPITVTINEKEYIIGETPLTASNLIVASGGNYYLDLRNLATAIGKRTLNDVSISVHYYATD